MPGDSAGPGPWRPGVGPRAVVAPGARAPAPASPPIMPPTPAPAPPTPTPTPDAATAAAGSAPPSILDDLGEDLTGVATPVAVCMALTVALCRALNPDGASNPDVVRLATLAYDERAGDSAAAKLGGGLLNALAFVAIMAAMTFGLFVLFKLKCYRVIGAYMGFSLFNIFFLLTGAVLVALARAWRVALDAVTLLILLTNLAAVGTAATFFLPAPLALRQALLVWVGVVMAFVFSLVPEWTTWCLLAAMAAYDLAAVLLPGGPLKIIVDLAVERRVDLPALVYESRPSGGRAYARGAWMRRKGRGGGGGGGGDAVGGGDEGGAAESAAAAAAAAVPTAAAAAALEPAGRRRRWWAPGTGVAAATARERSPSRVALLASAELGLAEPPSSSSRPRREAAGAGPGPAGEGVEGDEDVEQRRPLSGGGAGSSTTRAPAARVTLPAARAAAAAAAAAGGAAAAERGAGGSGSSSGGGGGGETGTGSDTDTDSDDDPSRPAGGMLLGMGDFIFYSALVGRAATYDLATVFAAFVAVLAGLVVTLLALSLGARALPALPVSIALGACYCFAARWALEAVAVPLTLAGAFY